jgi:hypothetical protein
MRPRWRDWSSALASVRVLHWVASRGVFSSVSVIICSTCASLSRRGVPGRGSSTNPIEPLLDEPPTPAPGRLSCDPQRRRDLHWSSVVRSLGLIVTRTVGRPLVLGGQLKTDNFWTGKTDNFRAAETGEFYFDGSSVRKSVWTLVRQLFGPHLSTWA